MNSKIKIFTLPIILQFFSCQAATLTGTITQNITTSSSITRSAAYIVSDEQIYTSGIGGIVFTYPTDVFTLPPVVQISVKSNTPHPTTEAYVAEISANSATETTIMVYKISSGVITEAASNDISVCLLSIADPV